MKCKNCGCDNNKDSLYCWNCGARLDAIQAVQTVPKEFPKWVFGLIAVAVIIVLVVIAILLHENKPFDEVTASKPGASNEAAQETDEGQPDGPAVGGSDEMQDESGIHSYSYIIEDCSWNEAFQRAKAAGGYLAHINSQEEFSFIVGELENQGYHKMQFYIGGRREPGEVDYYWVDQNNQTYGDSLNDTMGDWFWMEAEPSFEDEGVEERYMNMFYYYGENKWVGNDTMENVTSHVPEFEGHVGYIIEFDE